MRPSPRHEGASAGRAARGGRIASGASGASGRREARGAGVLTERSAAERASTRRPEESLSAWSQEPARTRGRPAPQRRSALHADTAGAKAPRRPATAQVRTGVQRPDPEAQRSGARGRVGTGNGCGTGIGNGCDLAHIYTYIPLPTQHERPSPGLRPGKDASVCGRARARGVSNSGSCCKRKTVRLFTE